MSMRARRGLIIFLAWVACAPCWAGGPSGGSYVILSSTIASGASNTAAGSYSISSSLGDLSRSPQLAAGPYQIFPGFWIPGSGIVSGCTLDLDDNGTIDALTDGLMLMRVMFGLTGTSVTNGAIGTNAQRTTWDQIQPIINLPALDIDGNLATDALTDGLILLRAMFGLTGTSVTNGAIGSGATRATWALIRTYVNSNCGANFSP